MNKHSAPLWDDVHLFNYSKFSRFRIRRCNRDFSEIWKERGRCVNKGRKLFPIVKCFGILWSENTTIRSERNIGRRSGPFRAGRVPPPLTGRVCGRCEPARRVRQVAHALRAVGRRHANESVDRALPRRENGCENLFVRAGGGAAAAVTGKRPKKEGRMPRHPSRPCRMTGITPRRCRCRP